jgi:hypothetical protein
VVRATTMTKTTNTGVVVAPAGGGTMKATTAACSTPKSGFKFLSFSLGCVGFKQPKIKKNTQRSIFFYF